MATTQPLVHVMHVGAKTLRTPAAIVATAGVDGTVVVAVIDGGMDMAHPDLQGALWTNPGEIPGNGIDDDGNGEQVACVPVPVSHLHLVVF